MKIDVIMNNVNESHSEIKLLGVTFDEYLNFSRHIGEVCKKACKKVGASLDETQKHVNNIGQT